MLLASMKVKDSGGYTLVEMLVVLMIVSVILTWTFISFSPLKASFEKNLFLSQIQADLYYLQSYAINHQEGIMFDLYPTSNKYVALTMTGKRILSRTFPPYVQFVQSNKIRSLMFYPNGHTNRFGSMYFFVGNSKVSLTFHIGEGRFYVEEL